MDEYPNLIAFEFLPAHFIYKWVETFAVFDLHQIES